MRTKISTLARLATAVLLLAAGTSSYAVLIEREGAVETDQLQVIGPSEGAGFVAGRQCKECELQRFPLTPTTKIIVNGEEVSRDRLRRRSGKPATIIYDLNTLFATKIVW